MPPFFPTPADLLKQTAVDPATNSAPPAAPPPAPPSPPKLPPIRPCPQTTRKPRHRSISTNVGFQQTDPDSISSHEKKRHYFESLESYVAYLHQKVLLTGAEPVPLQRVDPSTSQGLTNKAIRTLLLHMEATATNLNQQMLLEEREFESLLAQVRPSN